MNHLGSQSSQANPMNGRPGDRDELILLLLGSTYTPIGYTLAINENWEDVLRDEYVPRLQYKLPKDEHPMHGTTIHYT
jgi:hypothetical protein